MDEITFNKIVAQCMAAGATPMEATAVALAMKHAVLDPVFSQMYGAFVQDALVNLIAKA